MKKITKILISVFMCSILIFMYGCNESKTNSAEAIKSGVAFLQGETLPEGKAIQFKVVSEDEGRITTISGIRNKTVASVSVFIDHSKICYEFTDIYKRTENTVYVNLDMLLNLLEYYGLTLPDTVEYANKTISFDIGKVSEKIKSFADSILVAMRDREYVINESGECVMDAALSYKTITDFAASLTGRADELSAVWNDILAIVYNGEHKDLVKEAYDLYPLIPSVPFELPVPDSGRDIHETKLLKIKNYAELFNENPSATTTEQAIYSGGRTTEFTYTAVSNIITKEGNDRSRKLTVEAAEVDATEEFISSCAVSDDRILPADKLLSVLKSNLESLINSVYESDDFPYSMEIKENTLILSQTNDVFSESLSYVFLNGRVSRVVATYRTNTKAAHSMLIHEYNKLGYKTVKDESNALNTGEGQGLLIFESDKKTDFPSGYEEIAKPDQLMESVKIGDTPLYKGLK